MRINVKCTLPIKANDVDSALRSVVEEAKAMFGEHVGISNFIVDVEGDYVSFNGGPVELVFRATASFGMNVPGEYQFTKMDGALLGVSLNRGASA